MKKLFALVICLFALQSCETPPGAEVKYSIRFYNNSSFRLNFYVNYAYPDSTLPQEKPYLRNIPSKSNVYIDNDEKWNKVFSELPKDTLSLILINADSLDKYGWDTIVKKYLVLQQIKISYPDLEKSGFCVYYN